MLKKTNLIYIASNGRSGSTLLDLLLGIHRNIWTLGEFQVLPWEVMAQRQGCGCGDPVADCAFWKDILHKYEVELTKGNIHKFRQSHGQGKVLRGFELLRMFSRNGAQRNSNFAGYGQENALILQAILQKARRIKDVQYLVDASKDPYRLYWLAKSGFFQVYCIHLTKDPRAFVYSMIKNDKSNVRKIIRMSIRYLVENAIIDLVGRKCTDMNFIHIRYEDLASKPQETMNWIFSTLGLNSAGYNPTDFRQAENHAISGNAMRHRNDNIKLDEKWRVKLTESKQNIVKTITYPQAKRYGYF
ncbi:hypothetical protein AKJ60_00090 [candidate division MSBL1 archaeon SCGC-AAA385M11]|nr:hypothetical protein AKJ60_00090 [candidate division MSBL1 archaeon SCGC-AAA385M11]